MAGTFKLADLNIPEGSEFHKLLGRCPEIQLVRFDDGQYLLRAGEAGQEIFLVLRGGCVVEQAATDAEKQPPATLATMMVPDASAPAFVGEMAYLGGGVRTASVRSSGRTFSLCLKPEHLNTVMSEFPLFTRILCRQFAQRLRETSDALRESQQLFAMEMTRVFKKPGEVIFSQGKPADTLYQLVDGAVVREGKAGAERIAPETLFLGYLDPLPYFRDGQYRFTAKAETNAMLVAIAKSAKFAVIRRVPELLLRCMKET